MILKNVYLELAEAISQAIESVRFIDLWHNQIANLEKEYPLLTPSIFIEFSNIVPSDTSLGSQLLETDITFYITTVSYADTHTFTGSFNSLDSFSIFDLSKELHCFLSNYRNPIMGRMNRVAIEQLDSEAGLLTLKVTYRCLLEDDCPKN